MITLIFGLCCTNFRAKKTWNRTVENICLVVNFIEFDSQLIFIIKRTCVKFISKIRNKIDDNSRRVHTNKLFHTKQDKNRPKFGICTNVEFIDQLVDFFTLYGFGVCAMLNTLKWKLKFRLSLRTGYFG